MKSQPKLCTHTRLAVADVGHTRDVATGDHQALGRCTTQNGARQTSKTKKLQALGVHFDESKRSRIYHTSA